MRVLHWCMLGVTLLLLMCEVAISQLCTSLITLVDGFHTVFILMHMALPTQTAGIVKPPLSPLDSSASPPNVSSSLIAPPATLPAKSLIKPVFGTQTSTLDEPATLQPNHEAASPVNLHQFTAPKISPAAPNCGLSYSNSRIQAMGVFLSTLLLASLSTSYLMEIISFFLEPHQVQHPLLLVVVGAVSLLHKILVFGLNWDKLQNQKAGGGRQQETESHLQVNHKALAEEESIGREESKGSVQLRGQSTADDSLHSGALILCNPRTSSIPDSNSQSTQQQPEIHLQTCEAESSSDDLKKCTREHHLKDMRERPKCNTCMKHLDSQKASKTSTTWKSSYDFKRPTASSQLPVLPFIFVIQGLFTSFLALINSLVMLLIAPQFPHSSEACNPLVYLDPALSLLAVITLTATTLPQVYRYGLLLLQATPPHISVSDVERRIACIPGVQAVHDLHVWQLTESLMVASVHVHCSVGFPTHRCADVMSGVTKVLQSVGVSCCTVQPEFTPCCSSSAGSEDDASPVIHREDPSPPPLLACSLACGKACAGSMCCSLLEETQSLLVPPGGETMNEPQTLVIENTFL